MEFVYPEIIESEILYKKIMSEDFPSYSATFSKIVPNEQGYISEQIDEKLNYNECNTVVINAGVGQGKTHSILNIAKKYYDDGFVIVFAVPYKSLIDQYKDDLVKREIPEMDIVDYRLIADNIDCSEEERENNPISPSDAALRAVHLLTVNAILGNPGEDAITQSQKKIDYINFLINKCKQDGKKVVWIFDEIHDSIHNFQQKFVFNLWKWRDVLCKTFCISATYNEASKIVIKYLAELTNDTIHIIESDRIKFDFKRSDLYLLLYNKQHYKADDEDLIKVFDDLLARGKKINVLSYSKTLAAAIADTKGKIGKKLKAKFGEVNLCAGNNNNVFDKNKCNIGTTFSTGININGTDSGFIIILPSLFSYSQKQLGVFTRGINTLIQALARIRSKSEIYMIMPSPSFLIEGDGFSEYIQKVKSIDSFIDIDSKDVFKGINNQRAYIEEIYKDIRGNVSDEISLIEEKKEERKGKKRPSLEFPELDDYILTEGEKVLVSKYDIFGKNLSNYTFWAAFNDQFINCKLKGLIVLNELIINEATAITDIQRFVFKKMYEFLPGDNCLSSINNLFEFGSDEYCYKVLKENIFKNKIYWIGRDGCKIEVKQNKHSKFERAILAFLQYHKKDSEYYGPYFFNHYVRIGSLEDLQKREPTLNEYTVRDYLFACFKNANRDESEIEFITDEQKILKKAYLHLYQFWLIFKGQFTSIDNNGKVFFDNNVEELNFFTGLQLRDVVAAVDSVRRYDPFVKAKIFWIFQKFDINAPDEVTATMIVSFYKKTFFEINSEGRVQTENIVSPNNKRQIIVNDYHMPDGNLLNFLFAPKDVWWEDIAVKPHRDEVISFESSLGSSDT